MSIIDNYNVLNEVWENACEIVKDTETIARIRGISAQMATFDFFYGLVLSELLLRHTDNLSRVVQKENISASEGQLVASQTITTLLSLKNEDHFELFWCKVTAMANARDVDDPKLPRQRKRPKRYEEDSPAEFFINVKDRYKGVYYEAHELIVSAINDRFNQPGYRIYQCLENLFLMVPGDEDFTEILNQISSIYGSDINFINLDMQLRILRKIIPTDVFNIFDFRKYLQNVGNAERDLLKEVVLVMKIILVMPATNATSERSFSAMKRVKSYLRATMGQERLNNLMVLNVHKEFADSFDLESFANEFISSKRKRFFKTII